MCRKPNVLRREPSDIGDVPDEPRIVTSHAALLFAAGSSRCVARLRTSSSLLQEQTSCLADFAKEPNTPSPRAKNTQSVTCRVKRVPLWDDLCQETSRIKRVRLWANDAPNVRDSDMALRPSSVLVENDSDLASGDICARGDSETPSVSCVTTAVERLHLANRHNALPSASVHSAETRRRLCPVEVSRNCEVVGVKRHEGLLGVNIGPVGPRHKILIDAVPKSKLGSSLLLELDSDSEDEMDKGDNSGPVHAMLHSLPMTFKNSRCERSWRKLFTQPDREAPWVKIT
jgi:hypothetical protein